MKPFVSLMRRADVWLNTVAEVVLVGMMMLTVVDVFLRTFGKPIVGTYELVALAGAIVIGFAVPKTSWDRGHVFVDVLIENRSQGVKNALFAGTRIVGIIIYALLSWNLMKKGMVLQRSHEVSLTLRIPFYPAAYALALCFFVQALTLVTDLFRIHEGKDQTVGEGS
jgi:TRAP-type C4-dicarboxylate transport system permease small subunit